MISAPDAARPQPFRLGQALSSYRIPLVLSAITFAVYSPTLLSDFVYDGRIEILKEGFITSFSNLPAVLSLKVLGMKLYLGTRPGALLYLMLIASVCGKAPFGYHLCSNLLHAANVALLYIVLDRLAGMEIKNSQPADTTRLQIGAAAVALLFALHPIVVEPVSAINYSSDLLVTFFTLVSLLAAMSFRSEFSGPSLIKAGLIALCCLASVTCKESGTATTLLLGIYWLLYRRHEAKAPWLALFAAAIGLAGLFLVARFRFAPHAVSGLTYLGGSVGNVALLQPRLWIFMMGQLLWPVRLSADYTLANLNGLSTHVALLVLFIILVLQALLATKSRLGALGIAVYWLSLATVSNFLPLYRVLADRFYYLPLAGVAMQLLAILILVRQSRPIYWVALFSILLALLPLTALNFHRQRVFANEFNLWSDTLRVSPGSLIAHLNLGNVLFNGGQRDAGIVHYRVAVAIDPNNADANYDLGNALSQTGQVDEAIPYLQKAIEVKPDYLTAYFSLGRAFSQKGEISEALEQFSAAVESAPNNADAHLNLGITLAGDGRLSEGIAEFQKTIDLEPAYPLAHFDLGLAFAQQGEYEQALAQFQEALRLKPDYQAAQDNLDKIKSILVQRAPQN